VSCTVTSSGRYSAVRRVSFGLQSMTVVRAQTAAAARAVHGPQLSVASGRGRVDWCWGPVHSNGGGRRARDAGSPCRPRRRTTVAARTRSVNRPCHGISQRRVARARGSPPTMPSNSTTPVRRRLRAAPGPLVQVVHVALQRAGSVVVSWAGPWACPGRCRWAGPSHLSGRSARRCPGWW